MLPTGGYVVREFTQADIRQRDRAPRRTRGHRLPVRRRAGSEPPRSARAAGDQRAGRAARAPRRLRVVRALHRAQRRVPRAPDQDGAQPAARAHARHRPVPAVRDLPTRSCSSTPSCPSRARSWSSPTGSICGWSRRSPPGRAPGPTTSRASTPACRSRNLEIVLSHRGLLEQLPGASLIALDAASSSRPDPERPATARRSRRAPTARRRARPIRARSRAAG